MADESFGQNFMWYEWGFIAPEEFPQDEGDAATDARDLTLGPPPPYVPVPRDVWYGDR